MNSRERFLATMHYGKPDRVPYFEEGIREEVLQKWREQGLDSRSDFSQMFPSDRREEIEVDLEPRPCPKKWPTSLEELKLFQKRLDPFDSGRLLDHWADRVRAWKNRGHLLMLRVHRGFFLTMGVRNWDRFEEVILRTVDNPPFIYESMRIQADFASKLMERVLREVEVDAAIFSEPIGGNTGPLISPHMYEEYVLKSYEPLLDLLGRYHVDVIIFRTFANARILIPSILKWGFNCLWACEVYINAMDYRDLRREFGRDLRFIGGIDLDALRRDKESIRREIEEKVPPLIEDGGYIPLADGRIREDVPYENYLYYRELLETLTRP